MSMIENKIDKLIRTINDNRNVCFEKITGQQESYQADISMSDNTEICLQIVFPEQFPLIFPTFKIVNPQRFYAHVDSEGVICLLDDTAILKKTELPELIAIDCFDKAMEILNILPGSEEYKREIAREFNAYWAQLSSECIYTNIECYSNNAYMELQAIEAGKYRIVSNDLNSSECLLQNNFHCKADKYESVSCIAIRLRSFEVPPLKKVYKWKELRQFILGTITSSQKGKFKSFLNRKMKVINRYLILIIPFSEGDIQMAFHLYCKNGNYSKVEKMVSCEVKPVSIVRIDYKFMVERGGSSNKLSNKKILVLGCGSIGGYIINNLCQSGINQVDILDDDIFTFENIHRHLLGFDEARLHKNKADIMKEWLESQYPYVDIDSLNFKDRSAEKFLMDANRLRGYDLIVSALGEPTINLEIDRILHAKSISIPFVSCFNEPYGIGGHAICSNITQNSCLRCLYTDLISNELVPFRASLVKGGQNFKRNISGCTGAFVPYNALDTQQTALISTKLVLDILCEKISENKIISWLGSSEELVKNGFETAPYFKTNSENEKYIVEKEQFGNRNCLVCGRREVEVLFKREY